MEHGFTVIVCRACEDPPCAKACPENALKVRKDGGVIVNKSKCTGCKACVSSCILQAIFWDEERGMPMICIHCGTCANYCPHGVLKLEKPEKTGGVVQDA